jgi:Protein of unknown function (DUF3999)
MKTNKLCIASKSFLLLLLTVNQIVAQTFLVSAPISNIKTDGLHSLLLTPQIRSYTQSDFGDLRIFDAANKAIPYFVWTVSGNSLSNSFEAYRVVSKTLTPNKSTVIIVENKDSTISSILLNIANSDLIKTCNISGSNDQRQWFGLLDKFELSDLKDEKSTSVFKKINFPNSDYRYIKIELNDKKTAAINVLAIGRYKALVLDAKLQSLSPVTKTNNDSKQKKTRIAVTFDRPQTIDQLGFSIKKPNFYKRNVRILIKRTIQKRHKKVENSVESLLEFELNSTTKNSFELPAIVEKEFVIEIDNEDNPPLEIDNLTFSQLPAYLIADLKTTEKYTFKTGNETLSSPNYDIAYFQNNISKNLPEATIETLTISESDRKIDSNQFSFWQQSWFMWLCIGLAAAVILYFSSSLLKDMK